MMTAARVHPRRRRIPRHHPAAGRAPLPEIYFVKPIDNSRLRRDVDLRKRRQCFSLLGLGVLAFIFVFLYAHQHFQCLRYDYQIEQLKSERAALEDSNRQLGLEQARLADPHRIDTLARQRLGLMPSRPHQLMHVGNFARTLTSPRGSEVPSSFAAAILTIPGSQ